MASFARTAHLLFDRTNATEGLEFHGRTDTAIVRDFLRRHGIPDKQWNVTHFLDAYVFLLDHRMQEDPGEVLPGVREALAGILSWNDAPVTGLLTGNIRLGAEIKLKAHGLWDAFVTGAFGDDHEDRNQLARVARDRASRLTGHSVRGEEILVVGDTPRDVECARAIGARCLAVATGASSVEELTRHGPTWAVPTLAGLDFETFCA